MHQSIMLLLFLLFSKVSIDILYNKGGKNLKRKEMICTYALLLFRLFFICKLQYNTLVIKLLAKFLVFENSQNKT